MNQNNPRYTITRAGKDAVDAIMEGVRLVARSVSSTIGPAGLNNLIEERWGDTHTILNDGARTANAFYPEDPFTRAGAKIIQEAAMKQRDSVGDGTSVTCLLTLAITEEVLKVVAAGHNPMLLRKELEVGRDKLIKKIQEISTPITTLEQKKQIATISSQDKDLGDLIAETIHKIGDHGVLTTEESKNSQTVVEMQEGMQIDQGYAHWFMVTDPDRMVSILEDAHVLVTDLPLSDLTQVGHFINTIILPNTKRVLFISPSVDGDFEKAMLGARQSGQFLGLAVRASGVSHQQTEILMDIAALTGATFISKDAGMKFDEMVSITGPDGKEQIKPKLDFSVLGHVGRVISTKLSTVIQDGSGTKEAILGRIQLIRGQMEDESLSEHDMEQLKARLAKLTNGVAVLKIGGQTEIEMKERKERCIDAIAATQSAIKHGMVAGGEIIYLNILDELDETILGEKILQDALVKPFKQLAQNGGLDGGQELERRRVVVENEVLNTMLKEKKADSKNYGLDITDGLYKDMIKEGIIDPANVSIQAIKTAVSCAVALSSLGSATVLKNQE